MASMNVSVPDALRDWVRARIDSGDYATESEYLRDLILRDRDAHAPQMSVDDIRDSIDVSRADARTVPAEEVFHRLQTKLNASTR